MKITLDINKSVYDDLVALIDRPEFAETVIDTPSGKTSQRPIFSSPADFLTRRIMNNGLAQHAHLLPSVAQKQEAIKTVETEIRDMLTPSVVDVSADK